MELSALPVEVEELVASHTGQFLVFPESRLTTAHIRMFNLIPAKWAMRGPSTVFSDTAQVGEYFTFQLGVYAAHANVSNLRVEFSDLISSGGPTIPAARITCFNLNGVDETGTAFAKKVDLAAGMVQALWVGIDLPALVNVAGLYVGTATVIADNCSPVPIALHLQVVLPASGHPMPNQGFGNVYNMTRLAWLDSTFGIDANITRPFTPVQVNATEGALAIKLVNKVLEFDVDGFLAQGTVITARKQRGVPVAVKSQTLAAPVRFRVTAGNATEIIFETTQKTTVTAQTPAKVTWQAQGLAANGMRRTVTATAEFDSYLLYNVTFTAGEHPLAIQDIQLQVAAAATNTSTQQPFYMSGMGSLGGFLQDLSWRWERNMTTLCCGNNMVCS